MPVFKKMPASWVAGSYGQFRLLLETFYLDSKATAQCELFLTAPNRNVLTYLLASCPTGPM